MCVCVCVRVCESKSVLVCYQFVSGSSWVRIELSIFSVWASRCSSSVSWLSMEIEQSHAYAKLSSLSALYTKDESTQPCDASEHTHHPPVSSDFLAPLATLFFWILVSSADLIYGGRDTVTKPVHQYHYLLMSLITGIQCEIDALALPVCVCVCVCVSVSQSATKQRKIAEKYFPPSSQCNDFKCITFRNL